MRTWALGDWTSIAATWPVGRGHREGEGSASNSEVGREPRPQRKGRVQISLSIGCVRARLWRKD